MIAHPKHFRPLQKKKANRITQYQLLKAAIKTANPNERYDHIGYLQKYGTLDPDPVTGHYPDEFKLPSHPTFSTESVYSNDKHRGGTWNGDYNYDFSDYTFEHSDDTLRYLKENDPNVTPTYKGGVVLPSVTVYPKNHFMQDKDTLPGFAGGRDEYDDAMDFIAGYEDFSATPYNHDGIWTIGYGSTDPTLVRKGKISKAEARGAMRNYLVGQDRKLGTLIPGFAGLPNTAKNALRSYNYNYNITAKNSPKLLKALSTQNWAEAARQIDAGWNQVGQGGLRKRRQAERDLFLSGFNTAQPAAPIVQPVVQPKSQLVQQLETQPVFQPVINPLRMRERSSSMMPSMEQYMQSILQ